MIWTRSPRCSRRLAMAVTDRGATTSWPSMAPRAGGDKSWVLAMLAAKRRLRVAPVPPQAAADLTRPARVARTMPGRDEGTGALIEPRNNHAQASRLAVNTTRVLQSFAQWWVRLNSPHTQKFGYSPLIVDKLLTIKLSRKDLNYLQAPNQKPHLRIFSDIPL